MDPCRSLTFDPLIFQSDHTMKKFIPLVFGALLFGSQATAQTTPAPTEQKSVQDEMRATSGQLKEAYGAVSQQLAYLNREIGTAEATAEQTGRREALSASLLKLEGMLTTVNSRDESQWAEIKAKAEMVRTEALALVPARK